jgi:hypothetical protein
MTNQNKSVKLVVTNIIHEKNTIDTIGISDINGLLSIEMEVPEDYISDNNIKTGTIVLYSDDDNTILSVMNDKRETERMNNKIKKYQDEAKKVIDIISRYLLVHCS